MKVRRYRSRLSENGGRVKNRRKTAGVRRCGQSVVIRRRKDILKF